MAHETIQWGKGPANDDGRRERSRDNRPNREPDLFEALGVKRDAAVAAAIEAVRDSLDGFDPGLLTTATPGRRISSVPAIRARISGMAMPAAVGPAPAPFDIVAGEVANDDQSFSVPGLKRKPGRNSYATKWALAFAVSIVSGALAGRASRQHPVRATSVHVATAVGPVAETLTRTAAPVRVAAAPVIHAPAPVAPVRNAMPAVAAIEPEQSAVVVADEEPVEHGRHRRHRGVHEHASRDALAHAAPAPEAVAAIAAPAAPSHPVIVRNEAVAPAAVAPSARIETASPRASASYSSSDCAARCAGDLSCAADCVVHGARVARAAEIPSAPAARVVSEPTPEMPRRESVANAIGSLQSAMRACAGDDTRTAYLTINFASSGRVTTAVTEAPYAGTAAGSCMARAARGATVPAFTRPSFSVRAPFAMR